MNMKDKSVRL